MARNILTVSQLTENIKQLLEDQFSMVWISGETSNLRIPPSGHAYFTLKDEKAQISAVMFRGQMRQLKFALDDGMNLIGLGRISVYPPRGNYQLILEYAEPQGVGALQVAFEQLKQKLETEGLFLDQHKQALPLLPKKIGVITSPSGSVIQDILKVLHRRYHNLVVDIYPVRVQGAESATEIVNAISLANRLRKDDVLIIARGGGSLEDLSAFNDENVARAIFESDIPIVSAVGHETDYTISDFVADLRAPTPSAAAELTVPLKDNLQDRIIELKQRIEKNIINKCIKLKDRQQLIKRRIVHPGKKLQDTQYHLDHLTDRLERSLAEKFKNQLNRHSNAKKKLIHNNPNGYIDIHRSKLEVIFLKLMQKTQNHFNAMTERYKTAEAVLNAMNPSAILKRGYSITRSVPDHKVVMSANKIMPGQLLEVQLAEGKVDVSVIRPKVNATNDEE